MPLFQKDIHSCDGVTAWAWSSGSDGGDGGGTRVATATHLSDRGDSLVLREGERKTKLPSDTGLR